MSQAKHTPSPWHIECNFYVYDANRHAVASSSAGSVSKAKANAALIAVAPDLLAVSEIVAERGEHWIDCPMRFGTTVCCCPLEPARAAIAKVRGE